MIYDKAKLLSVFDMTKDAEPMRTGNPSPTIPVPTQMIGETK
jgi:NADH-quinone oxidoreductase subunit I